MSDDLSWPLRRAARLFPAKPAVVDAADGTTVTYAELAARVAQLGAALAAVPEGGRVGVLAANSLTHLELFLGVPSAGRVVVSLNTRLAAEELTALAKRRAPLAARRRRRQRRDRPRHRRTPPAARC